MNEQAKELITAAIRKHRSFAAFATAWARKVVRALTPVPCPDLAAKLPFSA